MSNSICVSSAYPTNQSTSQNKNVSKKSNNISSSIETKYGAITKKSQPKVTAVNTSVAGSNDSTTAATSRNSLNLSVNGKVNGKTVTPNTKQTMNGYKSINGTALNQYNKANSSSSTSTNGGVGSNINNNNNSNHNVNATNNNMNNNNNETKSNLSSSDSFKRRLGTYPLSPVFHPEFLKCEYDLARSQVINSRSRSACSGEKNNNLNNNNHHNQINNNNNINSSSISSKSNSDLNHQHNKTNGFASQSLTSSPVAKDTNRNKVTIFGVNTASASVSNTNGTVNKINLAVGSAAPSPSPSSSSSIIPSSTADQINKSNETMTMNANCIQHATVDHLDDIKFIDSDDSEHRRHSPAAANTTTTTTAATMNVATLKELFNDGLAMNGGKSLKTTTSTLPASSSASKKLLLNDIYNGGNKYNTITNGSCAYQAANGGHYHHISNGLARKAVPEEMLSSTSSSTSTLSAMTESSTSSSLLAAKNLASKENGQTTTIKVANHLDGGDSASVSACKAKHFLLVAGGFPTNRSDQTVSSIIVFIFHMIFLFFPIVRAHIPPKILPNTTNKPHHLHL